jgi:hypothetical protein
MSPAHRMAADDDFQEDDEDLEDDSAFQDLLTGDELDTPMPVVTRGRESSRARAKSRAEEERAKFEVPGRERSPLGSLSPPAVPGQHPQEPIEGNKECG